MTYGPQNTISSYLPLDFQLPDADSEFKELVAKRERLTSSIVNVKENGNYDTQELLTAQQWFSIAPAGQPKTLRYTFRKVINFGAMPAVAGTKSVAHGITGVTNTWIFTKIQAVARNPTASFWIPIPYVIAGSTDNAGIYVDAVNVNIQVNSASYAPYTQCYVVLEYIKG